ncbi:hypothetical protein [Hymenobacter cellulosilyticus]|uniref:Uncharacterized protein n=1 Tax=Hymenobacter cellulosilyticus TaxID=2932248 RepID=A0A8T9Q4X7_9BACT|nr:hypothetical protein [Hymenobacter cellulosilyticus]UOQ70938.1 hypothetical protein MUN79_19990 [Hymenobacter cellulosilyticus]
MSNAARWKLVLGSSADADNDIPLSPDYGRMDQVLTALYDDEQAERKAGLGGSAPKSAAGWATSAATFPRR